MDQNDFCVYRRRINAMVPMTVYVFHSKVVNYPIDVYTNILRRLQHFAWMDYNSIRTMIIT